MSQQVDEVIQAAARVLMKAAMAMIQEDPHQWSDRPCKTCRVVTAIINEPFGCYKYQLRGKP